MVANALFKSSIFLIPFIFSILGGKLYNRDYNESGSSKEMHAEEATIKTFKKEMATSTVFAEGGSFEMGSKEGSGDERPVHTVVPDDFYMWKWEVRNCYGNV